MENKKYRLDKEDSIERFGVTLFRVVALVAFGTVEAGEKGGYIESEKNLSIFDNAWIYGNARIYDNARIFGNAVVFGNAEVYGNTVVFDNARIYGNARIYDNARIFGNAVVFGNTEVYGNTEVSGDARVSENTEVLWVSKVGSSKTTLTVFRTKDGYKLKRGCFLGTMEEFKEAVNRKPDSDESKEEYLKLIPFIEYKFDKFLKKDYDGSRLRKN